MDIGRLGLQRISRLLYDTPLQWRAIHVAGTNGKGSTCAYISEMLQAYNSSSYRKQSGHKSLRHGRFTSPHLIDRWDCITVNAEHDGRNKPVSSELFHEVENCVLNRAQRENIQATEFELLTATAFEVFNRSDVDIAVVEVGVGGRLDSTNILGQPVVDENGAVKQDVNMDDFRPKPLVTAIAKIGMDHQGLLGDTIEEIALEKAGILKSGVPVVYDQSNDPRVQQVLQKVARTKNSPIIDGHTLKLPEPSNQLATHVRQNLGVAYLATWQALVSLGRIHKTPPTDAENANALQELQSEMMKTPERIMFPGRQEWVDISSLTGRMEPVLLDGAHNPQSAKVLADKVREIRSSMEPSMSDTARQYDPVTWVVAMSKGKPVADFCEPLLESGDNVFAVEFGPVDGMPWVEPAPCAEILESVKALVPDLAVVQGYGKDVADAIQAASTASNKMPGRKLVIAGSLYLVGDVHRLLRDRRG